MLLTHGYTSSHLFADGGAASEGSWSPLVGPGCAIDTDRFFVVSSNMLGSSFGSTGPGSLDPATGRPYGPDFPRLTLADIVAAQRRLVEGLGVRQLAAVVGPSYGGFQAFAWGVEHPEFVRAIAPVTTAPRMAGAIDLAPTRARLAADPAWNGGRYAAGAMVDTMTALREDTLRRYGIEAALSAHIADRAARAEALRAIARRWAEVFDPHSLLVLGDAANQLDATPQFARLRARAVRAVDHGRAVPAGARGAGDGRPARRRRRGLVRGARQPLWPPRSRPRRGEVGAGARAADGERRVALTGATRRAPAGEIGRDSAGPLRRMPRRVRSSP